MDIKALAAGAAFTLLVLAGLGMAASAGLPGAKQINRLVRG